MYLNLVYSTHIPGCTSLAWVRGEPKPQRVPGWLFPYSLLVHSRRVILSVSAGTRIRCPLQMALCTGPKSPYAAGTGVICLVEPLQDCGPHSDPVVLFLLSKSSPGPWAQGLKSQQRISSRGHSHACFHP